MFAHLKMKDLIYMHLETCSALLPAVADLNQKKDQVSPALKDLDRDIKGTYPLLNIQLFKCIQLIPSIFIKWESAAPG